MSNLNTNTLLRNPADDSRTDSDLPPDLFASACDAFPNGVYAFDRHGRLTTANRAGALLQGRSAGPLIGKSCCEMFWREPGSENCVVDRALRTGERVEVEMLAGDDAGKPTLVIVQPNLGDGPGMRSAIVIARDISVAAFGLRIPGRA